MGRRKGRKKTRRAKASLTETQSKKRETKDPLQLKTKPKGELPLPPLSEDGLKVVLGMASLERIEQIRRA